MGDAAAPRKPPMAEEAPGEPESLDEPEVEERQLQESFESPPPRHGDDLKVRQMAESDEDLG